MRRNIQLSAFGCCSGIRTPQERKCRVTVAEAKVVLPTDCGRTGPSTEHAILPGLRCKIAVGMVVLTSSAQRLELRHPTFARQGHEMRGKVGDCLLGRCGGEMGDATSRDTGLKAVVVRALALHVLFSCAATALSF